MTLVFAVQTHDIYTYILAKYEQFLLSMLECHFFEKNTKAIVHGIVKKCFFRVEMESNHFVLGYAYICAKTKNTVTGIILFSTCTSN